MAQTESVAPLAQPVPPSQDFINHSAYWSAINSPDFQQRCHLLWTIESVAVTTEDPATSAHLARLRYVAKMFNGIITPMQMALAVMTNTTIQAAVVSDYTAGAPVGNSVSDNDIEFTINSLLTGLASADYQLSQTP